jgi:hypothetical protein
MRTSLDLYLIETAKARHILFSPPDNVAEFEKEADKRIFRFIGWFRNHRKRWVSWLGRALEGLHEYYRKLEDRIDPGERILKAMSAAPQFVVYHGHRTSSEEAGKNFQRLLKRQRLKHLIWLGIDLVITSVVVVFTPVLAPIPGPNVFFYIPLLRLLSHYSAWKGTRAGLHSSEIDFKCLPDLTSLEENLRMPSLDRHALRTMADGLKIRGLKQFLERKV